MSGGSGLEGVIMLYRSQLHHSLVCLSLSAFGGIVSGPSDRNIEQRSVLFPTVKLPRGFRPALRY